MIKDKLEYSVTYSNISSNLDLAFEWLKNNNLKSLNDGKYIINENIFANIQSYETKDNAPFEAHRKYIDIQYMIDGEEFIEVADYKDCSTTINYDIEKDIEFLDCNRNISIHSLKTGEFVVLFPHDAHKPALNPNRKLNVKKIIVKVSM